MTGNTNGNVFILGTKDASGFYITVLNTGTGATTSTITANISAHRTTGTGTLTRATGRSP